MVEIKIIIAAVAIISTVLLIKKKSNIGIIMIVESVFLAAFTEIEAGAYLKTVFMSVTSASTVKLVSAFVLIMVLEKILRNTGMLRDISESLKGIIGSNRAAAGALPLVVGLLPSPGGARFSCPMVEEAASENTDNGSLTFVNYWFRHAWMDGFMLYPGVILASELLGTSILDFFARLLPFMILTVVIGYAVGLRKIRKEKPDITGNLKNSLISFITAVSPVISVIAIYMILLDLTRYALEISLAAVCVSLFLIKRYSPRDVLKTLRASFPVKLVIIIAGVMIFKDTLFETGILNALPGLLENAGIPVYAAYLALPFITGFMTGICVSFVSITFPVLLTIGLADNIWYGVLAYAAGYIGIMVTPVHLCMVVTCEYFKHSVFKIVRKVALSEIPLAAAVTVIMILLFR